METSRETAMFARSLPHWMAAWNHPEGLTRTAAALVYEKAAQTGSHLSLNFAE